MQRSSSRWAHNSRFYTAVIVARIDDSRKENKGNKKIIFVKKKNSSLGRKSELHSCILSKLFFQNFQKSRFESETRRCFNLSQGNRNFSSPGKIREVVTRDKRGLTGRVEKILPPSFLAIKNPSPLARTFIRLHPPPTFIRLSPLSSAKASSHFHVAACSSLDSRARFPHIYATVARPDTDLARETFSRRKNARHRPQRPTFTRSALV